MSNRNLFLLGSSHLRFFSSTSTSTKWKIIPKRWRRPAFAQPDESSLKARLAPSISSVKTLNRMDLSSRWTGKGYSVAHERDYAEQELLLDVVKEEKATRGNSVTAAQFLVFNGASVRFSGYPDWIRPNDKSLENMPRVSESANHLEAIDMSDLPIDYGVICGLKSLNNVKSLCVDSCPQFDDWCLDHVTGNMLGLEVLNLSNCPKVTYAGLGTLYRLRNLQTLKLHGFEPDPHMEYLCILLEEHFKDLNIEGIKYSVGQTPD